MGVAAQGFASPFTTWKGKGSAAAASDEVGALEPDGPEAFGAVELGLVGGAPGVGCSVVQGFVSGVLQGGVGGGGAGAFHGRGADSSGEVSGESGSQGLAGSSGERVMARPG